MIKLIIVSALLSFSIPTLAAPQDFTKGPVFENYGENTPVINGLATPETQHFKVVFDISEQSSDDTVNRNFNSVARFINMHVRAGVPKSNIEVAMVIHGKASFDLMSEKAYSEKFNQPNNSTDLVNLLSDFGVKVFMCGQSASYHGISNSELNAHVQMSLSAMTANALLQQQGYTLNPF